MNANELAKRMAPQAQLTRSQAFNAVMALGHTVVDQVKQGGAVVIPGFGLFEPGTKENGERYLRFRQHKAVQAELKGES